MGTGSTAAGAWLIESVSDYSGVPTLDGGPDNENRRALRRAEIISIQSLLAQPYATRGALLRELRWKNSAWLATAETIAGWNGFEIRNAGSGRSPVRKRSG